MEVPLRFTKYESSTYSYPLARTFRHTFYPTDQAILYPRTKEDFMDFVMRCTSPVTVLFGHGQDPIMHKAVSIVTTFAPPATLVVVDVGVVPDLGAKYDIRRTTLMKIYRAHVVRIYTDEFKPLPVKRFILNTVKRNVYFG